MNYMHQQNPEAFFWQLADFVKSIERELANAKAAELGSDLQCAHLGDARAKLVAAIGVIDGVVPYEPRID